MTAPAQLNIAMVLRADTANAKAGLTDITGSLQKVKEEAAKTGAATAKEAAELEGLAAAAAKAARAQTDLVAAERNAQATRSQQLIAPLANPQQSAAPVVAFWRASETAASSLRDTVAGLNITVGQQAHELMETAQATAQWRAAMDDVRASFNPLFAASRQYEQQLERIAEAERLGAISAREAAAARERAVAFIAPAAGGVGVAGGIAPHHTANVAAQGFDVITTAAMGMNPAMIAFQQGPQFVQAMQSLGGGKQALAGIAQGFLAILNPMSLATIGMVAFGALAIQGLMRIIPSAKTLEERMDALTTAFERYRDTAAISAASADELAEKFGAGADAAQGLYLILSNLSRLSLDKKLSDTVSEARKQVGMTQADMFIGRDGRNFTRFFGLGSGYAAESANSDRIAAFGDALKGFETAKGAEAQTAAMQVLLEQVQELATLKDGVSDKEQGLIDLLKQQADILLGIQAAETARQERIARQIEETVRGYGQQSELQQTILKFGQDSAQARAVEARQERETLALKLEKLGLTRKDADWQRAMGALSDLQHQRELAAMAARREWFRDQDDRIAAIQRETALIGSTAAEQARINALAEAEVEIRKRNLDPLEAAEARTKAIARAEAEIAQTRARALKDLQDAQVAELYDTALTTTRDPYARAELEAQREYARQIADGATAEIAAGHATLARARALRELQVAQGEYLRGQEEQLAKLRLELALVGQTAEVRARVLALAQAEQEIQRLGLDGELADQARRRALAQAELGQMIEAQADAWKRVQSAGEAAIDGVLDKLRGGDVQGAMAEMLGEIEKGFFDLSIRNPLKNMLLGSNLGTWEDVGGWAGIWGRLTGAAPVDEGKLARDSVLPLQALTVTATNVILQGNLSGVPALGAANANAAPMSFAAGLPGSADVQAQIWSFFAAKGLAPHQIAGIMGNAAGESSFDPLAVGDNGTSFGLFQHHGSRGRGLLNAVGGMGGLENVQAQLEYVWQELLTTERAALERLKSAPTVGAATDAWMRGFERPSDEAMAGSWSKRLAAAEQAAVQFGNSVIAAGAQVDQGGTRAAAGLERAGQGAAVASQGMGQFGGVLGGVLANVAGMVGGKTGGILTTLLGAGSQLAAGVPLFREGGFTGGSDPDRAAGVVHEGEFVFDAVATRRIGVQNLEGIRRGVMRGFRSGGHVGPGPAVQQAANMPAGPSGRSPDRLQVSVDLTGARGDREIETMVQQAVAAGVSQGLDIYDREVLPSRVKHVVNDPWGS
ncbi:phage tail tip lysozyme [Paracoccus pantotrophus]|uniref:phage tail tip lysozyme n=1 Tax=Paracoccus pantotrophus TaxID=82367 RepID=UPI0004B140DC